MIKVEVFNGMAEPITIIGEGSIEDFSEQCNRSKIVGIIEKDTKALLTIPILKYPVKVIDLQKEEEINKKNDNSEINNKYNCDTI